MTKHNLANERIKRQYFAYLKEAKGRDKVRPGETNPAIDLMIEWLKTLDSEAIAWLYSNRKTFERYYLMENEHG